MRKIRLILGGYFSQTPERVQAWGFIVRQTGRSAGHILMPNNKEAVRICLNQYVETELARPTAEQFTVPALADMVALRNDIQQQWQTRTRTTQRRLQANAALDELCQQLGDHLRRALSYLVMVKFNGQGSRELGQWGFQVITRTLGSPAAPNGQPEAAAALATVLDPAAAN